MRDAACWEADDDTSLRHRHFRTARATKGGSPTLDRMPLLFNSDIGMLYVEPDEQRRALLPQRAGGRGRVRREGQGVLESLFGDLPYRAGDYVVIHRSIMHRWRSTSPAARSSS